MAKIIEFMENRDRWIAERYELIRERLEDMTNEDMSGLFQKEFISGIAAFLRDALRVYDLKAAQMIDALSLEQQKGIHDQLYYAPVWEKYGTLSDACWNAGEEWGPLLWASGQEWKWAADYALDGECFLLTIAVELFLQVYQLFCMEQAGEIEEKELYESVRQALYSHFSDYCDVTAALVYHDQCYPGEFHRQLLAAGPEDHYGLYRLGGQVDRQAEAYHTWLDSAEDATGEPMKVGLAARVMASLAEGTEEKKGLVLDIPVGYEPLGQLLWRQLNEAGYEVICLRRRGTLMARIMELRPMEELPELSLFWDRGLKDRRITEEKNARDSYRSLRQKQLAVIRLSEWGIGMGERSEENAEEMSQIQLTHTLKHDHIYEQFRQELQGLR